LAVVVVVSLAVVWGGAGAGCSRTPSGGGPASAAGAPAPPRPPAPPARSAEPFTHPLLAAAADKVVHEDCSRPALSTVIERIRQATVQATPPRARAAVKARPTPGAPGACRSPAIEELGRSVRQEMLGRVGACVAQDGPLDPEWDMAYSSVLALGVCLDCARASDEQTAHCRRALDVVRRIEQPAAADAHR
jgi:hypothetical protein